MAGRDTSTHLSLIQWNCRGFRGKRAPLQLLIPALPAIPKLLLLQDTQHQAKLPSYHAVHSDPTDTPRVSTLIHRTLTYQEHTITSSTPCVLIELIPTKIKGGRGDQITKFPQKNEFWIRADLDSASPFLSYLKIFPPKTISK